MIVTILYWVLLAVPASVIFLQDFQTTFVEDTIVGVGLIYIVLRMLNDKRFPFSEDTAFVVNTCFFGLFIGIAWLGLVRGYYDVFGKWLVLFPLFLFIALRFQKQTNIKNATCLTKSTNLLIALNLIVFLILIFAGRIIHREANEYYQFSKHLLVPSVCILPIISIVLFHTKNFPSLQTGKQHLHLFIPYFLLAIVAWSGNAQTWAYWYIAGKLEREWTPYQFDYTSQKKEYEEANQKPYEAARYYDLVRQNLKYKGVIPQYWQWDFMLQYRMAYQARRLKEASTCLEFLSPSSVSISSQIEWIKQLWNTEFLTDMLHNEDMYYSKELMMIDLEWDETRKQMLVMDIFGRVYYQTNTVWKLVWQPEKHFANAVDLEITDHGITVATQDGFIYFEKENPYWKELIVPITLPYQVADMEWIAPDACIVLSDYGQVHFVGNVPSRFPREQRFDFGTRFASDLEIDVDNSGMYVLDVFGGIHSYHVDGVPSLPHISPEVDESLLPYWLNQRVVVDMELDHKNEGIYIYNRMGEMYTIAVQPYRVTHRPVQPAPFRGVAITQTVPGDVYALESNGRVIELAY